ncbi:precorrin-6y C5,15-methyltransferase (decarboxylating) subunit CbiE [Candidatus Magnetominusculus dajiuhuensis]|uniref:precorrin-6y C5,15-methyltransferase (decarboxylating) subunit CbiE n=1 Tax=Candidatus Magnetominusculus dajiuhuensis TaxID=3137712 RepID=UPI003B4307A8
MYKITVISAGPGGAEYMTYAAVKRARACDILIGTRGQLAALDIAPSDNAIEENRIEEIINLIQRHEDRDVGVLVTGDAGIFSLSQTICDRFGKASVLEVIPGVSSIQAAFAKIKESWLDVRVFSFHGRQIEGAEECLQCPKAVILCDKQNTARAILNALLPLGLFSMERDIYVCQNLTRDGEKIIEIKHPDAIETIMSAGKELIVIKMLR